MKSFLEDFRTTKNPPMDEKEPEVEAVVENKSVTATEIQTTEFAKWLLTIDSQT